jgi:hypothetical protein
MASIIPSCSFHCGSSLPACSATMYAAYQSGRRVRRAPPRVWESPYEGPAVLLMNANVARGLAANALHARINRTQKLLAQAHPATLIPDIGFGNIEFGFRRHNQVIGHTGRALLVSRLPRTEPRLDFSEDPLFGGPVFVSANRGPAPPLACPQGRPTDLRRVEAFLPGLDRRLTIPACSFDAPLSILSKPQASWSYNADLFQRRPRAEQPTP